MDTSQTFWDKKAASYAKSAISDEATYQKKLAETQAFLASDMRVLEFGCGTGSTAIRHAPHVNHIDAIDVSGNMLDIARRRATETGVDNVTFTRGTLETFPAAPESYDAVLGLNVIHLLPDAAAVIRAVAGLLKPGGVFVSSTVCLGASPLRFITLMVPLGKLLGLMPDVFVLKEPELTVAIEQNGFDIESQWHHGKDDMSVFVIARKRG